MRQFCYANPGVLDFTVAWIQLPPVGDTRSPYQVPPPESSRPIPRLPLNALMSLDGNQSGEERECAWWDVYVYHLVDATI